jgi:hypothetical protein
VQRRTVVTTLISISTGINWMPNQKTSDRFCQCPKIYWRYVYYWGVRTNSVNWNEKGLPDIAVINNLSIKTGTSLRRRFRIALFVHLNNYTTCTYSFVFRQRLISHCFISSNGDCCPSDRGTPFRNFVR